MSTKIKEVDKLVYDIQMYRDELLRYAISRGRFDGIPEYIPDSFINEALIRNGMIAVFKVADEIVVAPAVYTDRRNRYGVGDQIIATCINGETYKCTVGVDCVVGHNNSMSSSEMKLIERYVSQLAETDMSLDYNLLYSRFSKMFRADTENTAIAIKKAFNEMRAGMPVITVVSATTSSDFADASDPFVSCDLTDVNQVDKLQFLCRYHDYLITEYMLSIGYDSSMINKSAQVQADELDNANRRGQITAYEHIKYRLKLCDDVNKLFGLDWKYIPDPALISLDMNSEAEELPDDEDVKEDDVNEDQ